MRLPACLWTTFQAGCCGSEFRLALRDELHSYCLFTTAIKIRSLMLDEQNLIRIKEDEHNNEEANLGTIGGTQEER